MYAKLFNNYLNPFYESVIKKRKTYCYLDQLKESQFQSIEKNRSNQLKSLQNLLLHAKENCPYYSTLLKDIPLSPGKEDAFSQEFSKIKFLTKDLINENRDTLVARNYRNDIWSKSTGGSTGKPLHFYYTKDSNDWRVASTWRGYGWAGCHLGLKQAYIWGSHIGDIPRWKRAKENLHFRLLGQKYFNCFEFTEESLDSTFQAINAYKPKVIVGYTNPLYNFAKHIKNSNQPLSFTPLSIITAAEALHDFQRNLIEDVFGCSVFHTYGSREFMLIASECEQHDGLHISMENIFLEIIKDDGTNAAPGEIGEIVITDLHNYGMPFIRYKIGDLGVLSDKACACGRGLPILEKVVGRSLDMLKTSDGRLVPGEFFPHFLKDFKEIKQFQVVQHKIDSLEIVLVTKDKHVLSPQIQQDIEKEISNIMGDQVNVQYTFVNDIPLTPSGKRRVTICRV